MQEKEYPAFVKFTIHGEPASAKNQRQLIPGPPPRIIKSKKALAYRKMFEQQCPRLDPMFEGDVYVTMTIYYASRRPDLDEALILDCMQGFIYKNDRAVKCKIITWGLDKEDPRAEIEVRRYCQS